VSIAVSFVAERALDSDWGLLEGVNTGPVLLEDLLGWQKHLAKFAGVPRI